MRLVMVYKMQLIQNRKTESKGENMGQLLSLENVTLAVEKENSNQAIVKHVSFLLAKVK